MVLQEDPIEKSFELDEDKTFMYKLSNFFNAFLVRYN